MVDDAQRGLELEAYQGAERRRIEPETRCGVQHREALGDGNGGRIVRGCHLDLDGVEGVR
jgi:hypothetical protein